MKKQLQKKFYAFIITSMMFSSSANAQIIYTDVNPDSSVSVVAISGNPAVTENYYLDLNNDANNDFILTAYAVKVSFTALPFNGLAHTLDAAVFGVPFTA